MLYQQAMTMSAIAYQEKRDVPGAADSLPQSGWKAGLQLTLAERGSRTVVQSVKHHGPLRVQRPFYPEGPVCHVYLLHPPGGMVAGDRLSIEVAAGAGSRGLLTTPAAGKFYRVAPHAAPQYQAVTARLEGDAALEWLPQESIVFNGARGALHNRFELDARAMLIGWDIVCLGRRASGERFEHGEIWQRIEIYRQGLPLFIDRTRFEGGSAMQAAPWGMHDRSVSGTFFATLGDTAELSMDVLRAGFPSGEEWGLTRRGEMLLGRYLGHSAEACRRGFEALWQELRPALMRRPALRPRIWNT